MYEFLDRRYAQALFDVAKSKDRVEQYIEDLTTVVKVIDESREFQQVISHPEITTREKKKFFISLFKGKIDEDLLTFLLILIEKDRIMFLDEKLQELKKINLEQNGTVVARVRTVVPLQEYQRQALIEKLSEQYKKQVLLEESIDPEILGGILIRVGGDLIDGTVRSTLEELQKTMCSRIEVES